MDRLENNEKFAKDINDLLKYFLTMKASNSFEQFYEGKVVDNNDPDKLGKCKIRVYGQFSDNIPDSDLPWAIPDFNFIGSEMGSFVVPPIGTIVKVYFRNNEIYSPYYSTKVINKNNMPSNKDDDYPNTMVFFETDNGDHFIINRKTGEVDIRFSSGTTINNLIDGTLNINTENTQLGGGNINIFGQSQINIKSGLKITIDSASIEFPPGVVAPTGNGPLCAMPMDPLTGLPQTGTLEVRSGPSIL